MADVQEIIIKYKGDTSELEADLGRLGVKVEDVQQKAGGTGEAFTKSMKGAGKEIESIQKKLGSLAKITVAAFAAKAIFEFSRALVQVSLDSDRLRPKLTVLNNQYREFLELIAGETGITKSLEALINTSNKTIGVFNDILRDETVTTWQKFKIALEEMATKMSKFQSESSRSKKVQIELEEKIKKAEQETKKQGKTVDKTRLAWLKLQRQLRDIREEFGSLNEAEAEANAQLDQDFETGLRQRQRIEDENESLQESFEQLFSVWDADAQTESDLFWESLIKNQERAKTKGQEFAAGLQNVSSLANSFQSSLGSLFELSGGQQEDFAEFQKKLAVFQIAIDTAIAISAAVATGSKVGLTPIEKAVAIAANIALVLANIAKAKRALSDAGEVPQFSTGVIDLQGKGTTTSDSILARLSKGESVMTAEETAQHRDLFYAIRKNQYDKYIAETHLPKMLESERRKDQNFAQNIVNSMILQGYNDTALRDIIRLGYRKGDKNTNKIVRAIRQTNNSKRRGW